jgi:hypothetical protein
MGRMKTPFKAAILTCVIIINTPNIIEFCFGAGMISGQQVVY